MSYTLQIHDNDMAEGVTGTNHADSEMEARWQAEQIFDRYPRVYQVDVFDPEGKHIIRMID